MNTWILVIYFFAAGNNGVAVTSVSYFFEESCKKAAAELTWTANDTSHLRTSKAICVNSPR